MTDRAQPVAWIEDLVRFLNAQPGVTAVRVDPAEKRFAVATLGEIDLAALESRLAGAIAAVEARLDAGGRRGGSGVPSGFVLRQVGGATEVARETCATAPTFWRWSEFAWPSHCLPKRPRNMTRSGECWRCWPAFAALWA